jgi:acyl-CoA reductase-like NAD-dependent aldehyde dehydrogenase
MTSKKNNDRIEVVKTWKLYMGGGFPRSESGRSTEVVNASGRTVGHVCRASRKDLRDAIDTARKASEGWARRSGYNRGQILYRMAEMAEGRRDELARAIVDCGGGSTAEARRETDATIDRLVSMAGWTDKVDQVHGCRNQIAGSFHNMSIPEPVGVVGVIAPKKPSLLGLVSLIAPALATGSVVVALGSEPHPIPTVLLGEICATSDVPAGVVNLLTGKTGELLPHFANHRNLDAVMAAGLRASQRKDLQVGAVDALTRTRPALDMRPFDDDEYWTSPAILAPYLEIKTLWHPIGS